MVETLESLEIPPVKRPLSRPEGSSFVEPALHDCEFRIRKLNPAFGRQVACQPWMNCICP